MTHVNSFRLLVVFYALCLPINGWCDDMISGHYCYTYGDKESLQEAREITRTLAIRNGVEAYKTFVNSVSITNNYALTSDIVQVLSNGFISRLNITKHTENGRTLCDSITAYIDPVSAERLITKQVENRHKQTEYIGIGYNGLLKILGTRRENSYSAITVTLKTYYQLNEFYRSNNYVVIDYYNDAGDPVGGDHKFINNVVANQMTTILFLPPSGVKTYRVWLPELENFNAGVRK